MFIRLISKNGLNFLRCFLALCCNKLFIIFYKVQQNNLISMQSSDKRVKEFLYSQMAMLLFISNKKTLQRLEGFLFGNTEVIIVSLHVQFGCFRLA
ncbi:MAG: hypothetical protein CFE24_14340 [Flavobacterium sp. BFFFF2]|nr:MAG: hypothetical protein CFE24_14340 [Flavobacterium sp. BFFFF2]